MKNVILFFTLILMICSLCPNLVFGQNEAMKLDIQSKRDSSNILTLTITNTSNEIIQVPPLNWSDKNKISIFDRTGKDITYSGILCGQPEIIEIAPKASFVWTYDLNTVFNPWVKRPENTLSKGKYIIVWNVHHVKSSPLNYYH